MADEYDISRAFEEIENELIASMIRNMDRHRAEEDKEGILWSQWQVEQLAALERYKRENRKKYGTRFKSLNRKMEELIRQARATGNMEQEEEILEAIRKGFSARKLDEGITGAFFEVNDRKLDALIRATTHDMERAETAILRMANDKYRSAIYNAQVYANTGAGTYAQAVDMATKAMLAAGLNCIEYANGARHTLSDYADMALRTASKRAKLTGEGEMRQAWGINTVIVNKRGNPCPKCLPFCGKVLVDDVWSGGEKDGKSNATGIKYPLMSKAVRAGLYHPRCKDHHTTYYEGISTPPEGSKYTKEELREIEEQYYQEQKLKYAQHEAKKYKRLSSYSLDPENKRRYGARASEWATRSNAMEYFFDKGNEGRHSDVFLGTKVPSEHAKEIIKETDLTQQMHKIDALIDEYLNVKSKWAGQVVVDDTLKAYGKTGRRTKVITVRSNTPVKSKIHELLHCRTEGSENVSKVVNFVNQNMNEAAVEMLAEIICDDHGISYVPSYVEQVNALARIAKILRCNPKQFAKKLIEIPFPERYNWLERQVYSVIDMSKVDLTAQIELMESLDVLYGRR